MFFEVYELIALLEKFGCKTFISSVEVRYMIADSSKPNKLRNVYTIISTAKARNVTIKVTALLSGFRCQFVKGR